MRTFLYIFLFLLLMAGVGGFFLYQQIFAPSVKMEEDAAYLYIPSGASVANVYAELERRGWVENMEMFKRVADLKKYPSLVKSGRYEVEHGMSNNDLVNLLRSGRQSPVKVTFNNIRTKAELAGKVSQYLEADSLEMIRVLEDEKLMASFGLNEHTTLTLFVPNTYEFYWDTSAEEFIERMADEHEKFWTKENRKEKAAKIGMSPEEVSILASIVQKETNMKKEAPTIAGVYMNRLRIGMPLQADPTLIWALGDFTIKRVLNKHKEIDSPYNTYKNAGLPPGPICLPEITYLDAVLDYEKHSYLYFVAKADFSGYSNFSQTYSQHQAYARQYQRALNKRGIRR